MKLVHKFEYNKLEREEDKFGGRKYITPDGNKVSSVTTILDKTKPAEAAAALLGWQKNIGTKKSTEITTEAAARGTIMHSFLEKHLRGENPKLGTNIFHKPSYNMAEIIMETYIRPNLSEIWGLEVSLFYPEIYAGTTDCVGVYNGIDSIVDFKQTNKPKTDERVLDYKLQLSAYALAHDIIHESSIKQGVILMCSKDLNPQAWILNEDDLNMYKNYWWARVAQYYKV